VVTYHDERVDLEVSEVEINVDGVQKGDELGQQLPTLGGNGLAREQLAAHSVNAHALVDLNHHFLRNVKSSGIEKRD
jgi:hypothetical protein